MTKTTMTTTRRTMPGLTVVLRSATAATTAGILWSPVGLHALGPAVRAVPAAVGPVPAEIPAAPGTVRPGCPRSAPPAHAG